jgi:hypothetical protein
MVPSKTGGNRSSYSPTHQMHIPVGGVFREVIALTPYIDLASAYIMNPVPKPQLAVQHLR